MLVMSVIFCISSATLTQTQEAAPIAFRQLDSIVEIGGLVATDYSKFPSHEMMTAMKYSDGLGESEWIARPIDGESCLLYGSVRS